MCPVKGRGLTAGCAGPFDIPRSQGKRGWESLKTKSSVWGRGGGGGGGVWSSKTIQPANSLEARGRASIHGSEGQHQNNCRSLSYKFKRGGEKAIKKEAGKKKKASSF